MGQGLDTLLVPVRGDGKGDNVLAHAAVLAHRFHARVRVVHCHPTPADMMPFGVAVPSAVRKQIEEAAAASAEVERNKLAEEFRALATTLNLVESDHQPGHATARFIEYEGKQVDAVRHFGRLADLICVAQPDRARNLGVNTLKSALFSSGRPVLLCPHRTPVDPTFADHIAIGWNGSLEASRAVALSMPLIAAAQTVTILTTEPAAHAATAADLQRYLELKGTQAEIHQFAASGPNVGRQLLAETLALGAGLLLMGAYHDSYERETIFGGNSQVVVEETTIPTLMAH